MIRVLHLSSRLRLALALVLLSVLSLPAARHVLEGSMSAHMLLQYPLLGLCGFLMAGAMPTRWRNGLAPWNAYGIAGLLACALIFAVLMIPRVLDLALTEPLVEAGKWLALLVAGAALRVSWRPAGLLVQGFFLGNLLPMMAVTGQLMIDSPVRLCNAYLLDDQVRLGQALLALAIAAGAAWFAKVLVRSYKGDGLQEGRSSRSLSTTSK